MNVTDMLSALSDVLNHVLPGDLCTIGWNLKIISVLMGS